MIFAYLFNLKTACTVFTPFSCYGLLVSLKESCTFFY